VKPKVVHNGMKMTIIQLIKDVIFAMPRMLQDRIRRSVNVPEGGGVSATADKAGEFSRFLRASRMTGLARVRDPDSAGDCTFDNVA